MEKETLLFSTIKDWEISKSDQTIVYLKEWMLVNGKSFKYKCYKIGYAELSERVTVFKNYLLLKKLFFWKSTFSEEVPTMLLIITFSGEKVPPKQ